MVEELPFETLSNLPTSCDSHTVIHMSEEVRVVEVQSKIFSRMKVFIKSRFEEAGYYKVTGSREVLPSSRASTMLESSIH